MARPRKKVVFMHIPKTAGTTFNETILYHISPNIVIYPRDINDYTAFSKEQLELANVITGHYRMQFIELLQCNHVPMLTATFLREPIARSLSQYTQIKETLMPDINLPQFLENLELRLHITSLTHHYLTKLSKLEDVKIIQQHFAFAHCPEVIENITLEQAIAKLESFDFIGLTERYAESLEIFSWITGFDLSVSQLAGQKKNVRQIKENIDEDSINYIKTINEKDTIIYNYSNELFDKRYSEMKLLKSRKYFFRALPKILSELSGQYSFAPILTGSGWHSTEKDDEQTWRWSGPATMSEIFLDVDRSQDLSVSLKLMFPPWQEWNITDLIFFEDGNTPVHTEVLDANRIQLNLPALSDKVLNMTKITIHAPSTTPVPDVRDSRTIGFALTGVKAEEAPVKPVLAEASA